MPPLPDLDETQPPDSADTDADSQSHSSGDRTDDEDRDDNQCTVPLGETLAVETETAVEDLMVYGETQAVDEEIDVDDWIETQVVGDDDEVCETEDEGVGDGDGVARVLKDGVDSDASTDAEGSGKGDYVSSELPPSGGSCESNNGSVRSIASVRAASLRSSGLAAAAKSITSNAVKWKCLFRNGENTSNHEIDVSHQDGVNRMMAWPNGTADFTVVDPKAGEIDKDHERDSFQKYTEDYHRDESKSRTNNPVAKKLFYEMTSAEEETTSKPDNISEKVDSPGSLVPDNITGLSYIGSQEPGDLSQANALDVVNKFLVVNDLGLSQEANIGKTTDMVKASSILSAKGAQILANKTDHRSPVGKTGTFEWIDSLEDEGGGEFFTKRRESLFKGKDGARKSRSQPPKSRHVSFGLPRKDVVGEEGVNPENHQKIRSLTSSDSRLMQKKSLNIEKLNVAETGTKKNLFKDLNEQSNSEFLSQQFEVTDADKGEGDTYEFGPDTQMAAEAMEALVCGTPINIEADQATHAHADTGKTKLPSEGPTKRTTTSKPAPLKKPIPSTSDMNVVSKRSKQRTMLLTKSKQRTPISSRINSRGKKSLECTREKTKPKRGRKKLEDNLNGKSSVNEKECSTSFKGEHALGQVDQASTRGANKCSNSLMVNVQLSLSNELIQGDFRVNSTPIAHRTRHSKAVRLPKKAEDVPTDCGKETNATINVRTRGSIGREDKLVADNGGSRKAKRKCIDIDSVQNAEAERHFTSHIEAQDNDGLHEEEARSCSTLKDVLTHPKRRRTRQTIIDKPNVNNNLKIPSLFDDSIKPKTQQRKITATVKSISEILDTAKRKRRSVSTQVVSEVDGLTSKGGKAIFTSSLRTRSSTKPNGENASTNCLSSTVIHSAGSTDVVNPFSTPPLRQFEDFNCQVEIAEKISKPVESPKGKVKLSGLACKTPSRNVDAVSPVCVAQDHPRTSVDKGRSRSSIARELIRLETSKSSPTSMFNMRRRRDMASVRVLFSHHLDEDIVKQQKKIMGRLGVPLASSISDATHFVTDNFVRTRNMLEAMALGKPVVTYMWLESCGQASCFIDEKNYILRDAKKEKEIGFSMPVSLARACQKPLLQHRRVYITPTTRPSMQVISSLVKAAHGQPLERIGRSILKDDKIPDDLLVLSCEEDYSICIPLLEKGAEIFSSELLLNGIVIQKLEYERHRLFLDHVRRTRSTIWLREEDGDRFLPVAKCT